MTKCIYDHHDLDGICSAAIVRRKYADCELIPYFYGEPFPWEKFTTPSNITDLTYMCDISLPKEDMRRLSCLCDLHWLDHHVSAIKEVEASCALIKGMWDTSYAGCELTWSYLFPRTPMPRAVHLLGRYDVWDHADSDVLPFQYGLRLQNPKPWERPLWSGLLGPTGEYDLTKAIIEKGRIILLYEQQVNQRLMKQAFKITWQGLTFLVLNCPNKSSKAFDSLFDSRRFDAVLLFNFSGSSGLWNLSFYSGKGSSAPPEMLEIAQSFGGGGHAGACGCQIDTPTIINLLASRKDL